jgi:hypothetical protein
MGVPGIPNGAIVSWRRVPNRSSVGFWYKAAPKVSQMSLAIHRPDSTADSTRQTLLRQRHHVNPPTAIDLWAHLQSEEESAGFVGPKLSAGA